MVSSSGRAPRALGMNVVGVPPALGCSCAGAESGAPARTPGTDGPQGRPRYRGPVTWAVAPQPLASAPRVLLLDEPLAGMGPEEGQRMAALLKGLAQDHAVLLIEHDMDFVFQVADRMTVMVEGRVIASGTPPEIRADPQVRRAYLGEMN